ncbi:MAG: hypothetical protein ACOYMA_07190, partial [Bacteroidia bacterium]
MRYVKAQGLNNIYDYIPFGGSLGNIEWGNLIWRAKELQQLCQAWDMLRWCYNIDPNLPNDNIVISRLNESAERIIDFYVKPLQLRAQATFGVYNLAHNNFNLVIGASLASAAICFHDFGTYFWNYYKSPVRWANSAYYNIHKVMWRDGFLFGKKMSQASGLFGYAEGTHYFMFAFENLIPMYKARNNFSPVDKINPYNSFVLDPDPFYVRNFWHDPDYHNLYEWYSNLIQPNGTHPTIDDSWPGKEFNSSLAILGNKSKKYSFLRNIYALRDLKEDYLVSLPKTNTINFPPSNQMASGDIVIRSRKADELAGKGRHYIHINAEKGSALNGGKGLIKSWGHEHDDFGSFIIAADNDLLMLDPPLFSDGRSEIYNMEHHNTIDAGFVPGTITSNLNDLGPTATIKLASISVSGGLWQRTFIVNRED